MKYLVAVRRSKDSMHHLQKQEQKSRMKEKENQRYTFFNIINKKLKAYLNEHYVFSKTIYRDNI